MSLIKNKFIGLGEIVEDSITDGVTTKAPSENAVFDALALKISSSEKGAVNGVATLDGGGKIPASQLPNSVMEFQGQWDASTNSPSLADGVGNAGDVYRVNVAGTQDLGSGSVSYAIGDWVMYNGTIWEKADNSDSVASVNGFTGVVVLDTDDISEGASNFYYTEGRFDTSFSGKDTDNLSEGATNLYFTDARAKAAAVADAIVDGVTDVAPSQNAVFDALALKQDVLTWNKENLTLIAGDITNQYIDLAQEIVPYSLDLVIDGVYMIEGSDYTLSTVSSVTRITFAGDIATGGDAALIAGDILHCKYQY